MLVGIGFRNLNLAPLGIYLHRSFSLVVLGKKMVTFLFASVIITMLYTPDLEYHYLRLDNFSLVSSYESSCTFHCILFGWVSVL